MKILHFMRRCKCHRRKMFPSLGQTQTHSHSFCEGIFCFLVTGMWTVWLGAFPHKINDTPKREIFGCDTFAPTQEIDTPDETTHQRFPFGPSLGKLEIANCISWWKSWNCTVRSDANFWRRPGVLRNSSEIHLQQQQQQQWTDKHFSTVYYLEQLLCLMHVFDELDWHSDTQSALVARKQASTGG